VFVLQLGEVVIRERTTILDAFTGTHCTPADSRRPRLDNLSNERLKFDRLMESNDHQETVAPRIGRTSVYGLSIVTSAA